MAHKLSAGQLEHPHPQHVFPFLLLRTMLAMAAAAARIKMIPMIIVAIFSTIHVNKKKHLPPLLTYHYKAA